MPLKKIIEILNNREFISVATCDLHSRPNAAPKFLLKIEGNFIYLVDYTMGRTWENLKVNPRASLSFMDTDTLMGYQINGKAKIIEEGPVFEKIFHQLKEREIDLSTRRIIEGVIKGKKHSAFELSMIGKFIIIKIEIDEIIEIGHRGDIKRENLEI